ncbi:hypothetical protein ACHAPT_006708 [Fusarium lateritium]
MWPHPYGRGSSGPEPVQGSSLPSPQRSGSRPQTPSSRPQSPGSSPPTPGSSPPAPSSPSISDSSLRNLRNSPLCNAEDIAAFTLQEKRFYEWYCKTEDHCNWLFFFGAYGDYNRFVEKSWSDPQEYEAYDAWLSKARDRDHARRHAPLSDAEFFERIRSTNFASESELGWHGWAVMFRTGNMVILGEATHDDVFTGYAIQPMSKFFWPHDTRETAQCAGQPGIMDESLLAINMDIRVDSAGRPLDATRVVKQEFVINSNGDRVPDSVMTIGKEAGHMVFVQLGHLCIFNGDWEAARMDEESVDGRWEATNFGVVAELNPYGQAESLWAIYNSTRKIDGLYELDEPDELHDPHMPDDLDDLDELEDGDATESEVRVRPEPDIARDGFIFKKPLGSETHEKNRHYVFKMSNSLQGLGHLTNKLDMTPVCKWETQIVHVQSWEYAPGQRVVVPHRIKST